MPFSVAYVYIPALHPRNKSLVVLLATMLEFLKQLLEVVLHQLHVDGAMTTATYYKPNKH
jgi:hypothetical protein